MNSINMFSVPVLACGMCIDTGFIGFMPFLLYWLFCLLAWSLLAGPICLAVAKRKDEVQARNPLWLFLGLIAACVIGSPILMGAVVAPIILVLPFWITAIVRGLRQHNVLWQRANQSLAILLLACVPISYAVPVKPFTEYRERLKRHVQKSQQPPVDDVLKAAPDERRSQKAKRLVAAGGERG
jgi:hypothetical protein